MVRVEDARGQPPTLPFWLGEAPGRSAELSHSVSRLRSEIAARLQGGAGAERIVEWLIAVMDMAPAAAEQLAEYLAASYAALGCLPTEDTIVLERFFDEAGGMQLVVHSPYGGRINRAWGLALRKRFCRKFNFELQAAATEDNIILSLTTAHSFDLADVARYLHSASVRTVLDPGDARCPDVCDPLALGRRNFAGDSPHARGPESAAAVHANGGGGPGRRGISGPDRLRRESGRRARSSGPSAGEPDHRRLPERCDGHRRTGAAAERAGSGRDFRRRLRSDGTLAVGARGAVRQALRLSRRRAAGRAAHPGRHGAALDRPGDRWRHRPARRASDRARPLRGVARSRQRGRVA